jgi:hypothetical protein
MGSTLTPSNNLSFLWWPKSDLICDDLYMTDATRLRDLVNTHVTENDPCVRELILAYERIRRLGEYKRSALFEMNTTYYQHNAMVTTELPLGSTGCSVQLTKLTGKSSRQIFIFFSKALSSLYYSPPGVACHIVKICVLCCVICQTPK